jgi:hypothetical protein
VLRVIKREDERMKAVAELNQLTHAARIEAEAKAVLDDGSGLSELIYQSSNDATVVFLGFEMPAEKREHAWHGAYFELLKGLPTTLIVSSRGNIDMMA